MTDCISLIKEWLNEYSSLEQNELKSFAAEHEHNHEIATAIFNLLYSEEDKFINAVTESEHEKIYEDVCVQLFSFYRTKEVELKRFTLQFIPVFIYEYLKSHVSSDKKCRCIETLLIALFNFEVVDENGKPKVISFRLPSLAQPSIYHEPLSLGPQFLTESALRRWEECNTKLLSWGPFQQVEVINAQNRLKVLAALLFVFNNHLSVLPKLALRYLCIAASRIVTHGFNKDNGAIDGKKITQRIVVSPKFLLELVEGLYFAMHNDFYTLALQAVQDIDQRAQYELFPDVMLVTGAIINSIENNPSGQPCDGTIAMTPATTSVTISKSMITNASFRTKKLPDDIPIQAGQVNSSDAPEALSSITEEGETDAAPIQRGATRSSKPKLTTVLGKKLKDKAGNLAEKKTVLKDTTKTLWNSLSGGGGDSTDSQQKNAAEIQMDANFREDKSSTNSGHNSNDNSDSRSHITSDSLDLEATPRFAAMQVSSV